MTSPSGSLSELAEAASFAVCAAAAVTRAVQRHDQRGKIDKHDGSPVTIADFAAQAVVVRELVKRLGPIRVVAEESSAYLRNPAHAGERKAALAAAQLVWPGATDEEFLATIDHGASVLEGDDRPREFWTIDPIDGTKGFIRGNQYCVCLALVRDGVPVVGALACPNLSPDAEQPLPQAENDAHGLTFVATADGPVLTVPADEPGGTHRVLERVTRRQSADAAGMIFCESWESSHSDQTATRSVMAALRDRGVKIGHSARIDSQCKYAVVARGQVDVFLRRPKNPDRRDWIWDHAPGWLIASRMGLTLSDAHGRRTEFGLGRTLAANHGVLAAAREHHDMVLSELRSL